MLIDVNYMGVHAHINKNNKEISIIQDNTNSNKLFNMIFKAILHNCNIDINNYTVINNS